jgi:hypothetical protein
MIIVTKKQEFVDDQPGDARYVVRNESERTWECWSLNLSKKEVTQLLNKLSKKIKSS